MVESARLESVYTLIAYRGFESLPLRQFQESPRKGAFAFRGARRRLECPPQPRKSPHVRDPRPRVLRRTARQDRDPADQVRAHERRGQAGQRAQRTFGSVTDMDGASCCRAQHRRASRAAEGGQ